MANPQPLLKTGPAAQMEEVKQLIMSRRFAAAITRCQQILSETPAFVAVHILLSQAYQQNAQFDLMLASAREAFRLQPEHFSTNVRLVECLIYTGEIAEAIKALDQLYPHINKNAAKLAKTSELYLHCSQFEQVVKCLRQATALEGNNPQYRYNLASALVNLGDFETAQTLLNSVIKQAPTDFDAYYNRSTLRRQTPENNHIKALRSAFAHWQHKSGAKIALGYALAKEYEDLGEFAQSFDYLQLAAGSRRKQLAYKVESDTQALALITQTFSATTLDTMPVSDSEEKPLFILGLPRSGTTLLERILSSHSEVGSLGEINNFAFSLIHCVGPNQDKADLIRRSTQLDFKHLAKRYMHANRGYGVAGDYLIDKTPLNFLYLGLIKKAFPQARIIHLQRNPLDSCYAIYKTLFRMGYPFSYDLGDLGQYYIAYTRLMDHWRRVFPDGFLDVKYESLVTDPLHQAQRLLDYCQLSWEPEVMAFHQQNTPSATASAAQVRQPVYTSSVNRWQHYRQQLEPLKQQLSAAGIQCD